MRRLRLNVAASVDGFIAGPNGEHDWITFDSSFDFLALYRQFDTLVMGRGTYLTMLERGMSPKGMGMRGFVLSTTLDPAQHPDITIVSRDIPKAVTALKAEAGKDIWLMGGAKLFRSLLDVGLVDSVELAVIPILLGSGVPLLPAGNHCRLRLEESTALPSGVLQLRYSVA